MEVDAGKGVYPLSKRQMPGRKASETEGERAVHDAGFKPAKEAVRGTGGNIASRAAPRLQSILLGVLLHWPAVAREICMGRDVGVREGDDSGQLRLESTLARMCWTCRHSPARIIPPGNRFLRYQCLSKIFTRLRRKSRRNFAKPPRPF